jgi:hypothetical protein
MAVASRPQAELGTRDILRRAFRYTSFKLGDAIRLREPVRHDGEWCVELLDPSGNVVLGELWLDGAGEIIPDRSATYDSVRMRFRAAGPTSQTT